MTERRTCDRRRDRRGLTIDDVPTTPGGRGAVYDDRHRKPRSHADWSNQSKADIRNLVRASSTLPGARPREGASRTWLTFGVRRKITAPQRDDVGANGQVGLAAREDGAIPSASRHRPAAQGPLGGGRRACSIRVIQRPASVPSLARHAAGPMRPTHVAGPAAPRNGW